MNKVKQPKWSAADTRRAARMGWKLGRHGKTRFIRKTLQSEFASNAKAIEWIMESYAYNWGRWNDSKNNKTVEKAIYLCCYGGGK